VELDTRLKPILDQTVGEFENLDIIWDDVLKLNIPALVQEKFPGLRPAACANLPYYITSPILTALLEAKCFDAVTVMVQKEVALRIAAKPGTADYSAFTVFCQYYAEPEILFDVPPHCFMPQPSVMSAVISLRVRENRPWDIADRDVFFRTVRASFAMRRKKLSNGLASGFPELGKTGAAEVIAACGFDENVRGETLGIPEFAALSNEIVRRRNHG
jgi:16S rRNA (adenine1518-N6/adenine1519-N6)-dimethyltransferase